MGRWLPGSGKSMLRSNAATWHPSAEEIDALERCASEVGGGIAFFEVIKCRAVLAQAPGRYPMPFDWRPRRIADLADRNGVRAWSFAPDCCPWSAGISGRTVVSMAANALVCGGNRKRLTHRPDCFPGRGARTRHRRGPLRRRDGSIVPLGRSWRGARPRMLFFWSTPSVSRWRTHVDDLADLRIHRDRLGEHRGHHVVSGTAQVPTSLR